jgi:riboflavin kinase / FMN adenylyltransferase
MNIFNSFDEARNIRNPVVTTGSFDGVHIGHKTILDRLNYLAGKCNGESVLITFDPHPRKVLYPETAGRDLRLINSREEKLYLLSKSGLNNVIIIEFTRDFSRITSEQFVKDILHEKLHARIVVVGFNHHFGFNKEGDYKQLWSWQEKYNFTAEEIPEQEVQHETVSSTKIRTAIREGYIQRANAYLDHYYLVIGIAERFGGEICLGLPDFFSVPMSEECKLLPSPGIYAVSVESDTAVSKGMVVITESDNLSCRVLLNIFDSPDPIAGRKVMISFHKKIHSAVDLTDSRFLHRVVNAGAEIIDLIY